MYHSITFGDKNTYEDWHIVPSSRPVFVPPQQKTKYLDIPGADGSLDLSEAFSGYPVYENREGSFEFIVLNGFGDWAKRYSDIMWYLHGKTMRAILEDDPFYFYEGRFSVEGWDSTQPPRSVLTINYSVNPYKWGLESSIEDWKWDPFNFYTGIIRPMLFKDIAVTSKSSWTVKTYKRDDFDRAPVCPGFIVSSSDGAGIDIRFVNSFLNIDITKHLDNGTTIVPDFIIYGSETVSIYFKGLGKVSVDFRPGRL